MEKLGFVQYFNFLDHAGMNSMLESDEGEKILDLAKNISVCLHEDWKKNLIREKGKDYQHFRSVGDSEFAEKVLAEKDKFLSLMSNDGKPLYRIDEIEKDGKKVYDVKFDLIRVPFENLTKKWQEANLDAAKFSLCLVKTAIENGSLNTEGAELFENFEKMSHDIHLEWMYREGDWAAVELLLPYEYLTVNTNGYNEKDKDRAHVVATTAELTFQPNILARNRSIVIRAINELFKSNSIESGLNPEIMQNIAKLQKFIDNQNKIDFNSYLEIKKVVCQKAESMLSNKNSISFEEFEKLATIYFETWKDSVRHIGELPKTIDVPYNSLVVDDPRANLKNVSRVEVKKILVEMAKEQILNPEIENDLNGILNANSPLGKRIASKNESDYTAYLASKQEQPN